MKPTLSILILVLEHRNWRPLQRHLGLLRSKLKNPEAVEVLIESDNGTLASGIKRQRLVNRAKGKYYCFVDDDDWVADDYLEQILKGCRSHADVVTFALETFGNKIKEFWRFGLYKDHRQFGLMAANHLCAWKSPLARQVGWCPYLGYGDDQMWYKPLMASGLVTTCFYINEPLYHYRLNLNTSANQSRLKVQMARQYVGKGLKCFWMGDEIVIQSKGDKVINSKGIEIVPDKQLEQFAVVGLQ